MLSPWNERKIHSFVFARLCPLILQQRFGWIRKICCMIGMQQENSVEISREKLLLLCCWTLRDILCTLSLIPAFLGVCIKVGIKKYPRIIAVSLLLCVQVGGGGYLDTHLFWGLDVNILCRFGAFQPMSCAWKEGRTAPGLAVSASASVLRGAPVRGGRRGDVIAVELLQKSGKLLLMALFLWQRLNDRLCRQRYTLGPRIASLVPAFHHASAAPWILDACCYLCLASLAGRWSLTRLSWCLSLFCCLCTFLFLLACQLWRRTSQGYSGTLTHWTSAERALAFSLLSFLFQQGEQGSMKDVGCAYISNSFINLTFLDRDMAVRFLPLEFIHLLFKQAQDLRVFSFLNEAIALICSDLQKSWSECQG